MREKTMITNDPSGMHSMLIMAYHHADVILALGDNAYSDGTDEEYQYAWFENMFESSSYQFGGLTCPGNHDIRNPQTARMRPGYIMIFSPCPERRGRRYALRHRSLPLF